MAKVKRTRKFTAISSAPIKVKERGSRNGFIKLPKGVRSLINMGMPGVYAFIRQVKRSPDGDRVLVMTECVERRWMDRVWRELLSLKDGDIFARLWAGREFTKDVDLVMSHFSQYCYQVYLWYLARLNRPGDNAPIAYLNFYLPMGKPLAHVIQEGDWYVIDHLTRNRPTIKVPGLVIEGRLSRDSRHYDPQGQELVCWLLTPRRVRTSTPHLGHISQGALSMLHYPQADPEPTLQGGGQGNDMEEEDDASDIEDLSGSDDDANGLEMLREALGDLCESTFAPWSWAGRALAGGREHVIDPIRRFFSPRPLLPALAGGPPLPMMLPPRPSGPGTAHYYIGYPAGGYAAGGAPALGAGPHAQAANPMAGPGPSQPFVGVLNVGEGNCNALYDNRGRAIVYYDAGLPTNANAATRPAPLTLPCFCDNPLMVLSHFDEDHYAMIDQYAACRALRWIVPQQKAGTAGTRLISDILADGGEVNLWTAASPSHMRFPWGFIERATGNVNQTNPSGLNMYVCVRDSGVNATTAGVLAAAANPCAPGQAILGMGRVAANALPPAPQQAVNAVAAATAGAPVAARATASALMLSPAAGATTPINAARMAEGAVAAAGIGPDEMAVAAAAALHLMGQGLTAAQVATAAQNAVANVPAAPIANKAAAIGTVAPLTGLGNAGHAQHVAEIAVEVTRYSAGAAPAQRAAAALAGAVTNALPVTQVALEATLVAATAASGAAAGDEAADAARALGVAPAAAARPLETPLPPLFQGRAPIHATERYVLLNGDANFTHIESQNRNPAPVVAALTAMHHGSNQDSPEILEETRIPWAPGTPEARAAATAHDAVTLPLVATASAVASALALAHALPRPQLLALAAATVEVERLGGNIRAVTVAAAAVTQAVAQGATAAQVAAGAIAAIAVVDAAPPLNPATAPQILADGGFQGVMPVVASRQEVANVAAAVGAGVLPGILATAAGASSAGGGSAPLVTSAVTAARAASELSAPASLTNALAMGATQAVTYNAGVYGAAATASHSAARLATEYLSQDVRANPRLVQCAAALAANAGVRGTASPDSRLVGATAAVLATQGQHIAIQGIAVAASQSFWGVAETANALTTDVRNDRAVLLPYEAAGRRQAMRAVADAAIAAQAAAAAVVGGPDAAAVNAVEGAANVHAALRQLVAPPVQNRVIAAALEVALAGGGAAGRTVAAAASLQLPDTLTAAQVATAATQALLRPLAGNPGAQVLADSAFLQGVVPGLGAAQANVVIGIAHDYRTGGASSAAAVQSQPGGNATRVALAGQVDDALACVTDVLAARNGLATAAVQVVRHAGGVTPNLIATAAHAGLNHVPQVVIERALDAGPLAAGGPTTLAALRAVSNGMGVRPGIVLAARWAALVGEAAASSALVESAAAEALGYEPDPVIEGLSGAQTGFGASALAAANAPPADAASRKIAYSYGVKAAGAVAPFNHCHRSAPFDTGPADPVALYKYESRGWTERLNTSAFAHQGKQPGLAGGHSAMGWESVPPPLPPLVAPLAYEGPLRAPPVPTCAHCVNAANPTVFQV